MKAHVDDLGTVEFIVTAAGDACPGCGAEDGGWRPVSRSGVHHLYRCQACRTLVGIDHQEGQ